MNYLFVGKNSAFETIIAALVFMNKAKVIDEELKETKVFGNIQENNKGEPIFIKADNKGNKVYTLGTNNYILIKDIVSELSRVAAKPQINLIVITVNVKGETITYYLAQLANLPVIGTWFAALAKAWVMYRKNEIISSCKELISPKISKTPSLAAKPLK